MKMNHHNECLLVVEDDKQIRNFICYALHTQGLGHIAASTGQGALSILISEQVDLMLLDLGLPDLDGMELIKKVRQWSEMPIIVVSARDQDKEKATALDLGADDYLTKPFSATELLARIRVALRHLYRQNSGSKARQILSVGQLQIDLDKRLVYVDGKETHVTPMEYKLLALFFKNMGKVLTTKQILKEVWGVGYGSDTQALRALMAGLRRKIEKNPAKPRYILTEIGVGYRLVDE
jgi:two-component system KDP operon response regulator KdpE